MRLEALSLIISMIGLMEAASYVLVAWSASLDLRTPVKGWMWNLKEMSTLAICVLLEVAVRWGMAVLLRPDVSLDISTT